MKALWVCNSVLPEFASEFGVNKSVLEGWITGMLHQMKKKMEIAFCFAIIDPWRAKDGTLNGHKYYSFQHEKSKYSNTVKERFIEIIKDYRPDIIHIWGSEFPHALAMVNASEEMGLLETTIINIQGFIGACGTCYSEDILDEYLDRENECGYTMRKEQKEFMIRGQFEKETFSKIKHVIGRTDWDYAWTKHINDNIIYHFGGEILRGEFYNIDRHWSYDLCEKYSIFVSQASYPIKGLDYLLRAVPDIIKDYPDMHIYVAGTDPMLCDSKTGCIKPYGMYLKNIIEEMGIQNRVTFLGRLDPGQMIERYLKANVFVSCSRIENSSNSVCEAAIVGTPIVASHVGGMMDLVQRISNIYLYQPGIEYMLAFYIKKIFGVKKIESTLNKILDFVDKEKNAMSLWNIYQELVTL